MVWVDSLNYKKSWNILDEIGGGGQGLAYKVSNKLDESIAFLKIIKSKNDRERRARFFREAAIYDTVYSEWIPKLIESNAHKHSDLSFTPYIVTDFIEGETLDKWLQKADRIELGLAISLTMKIATIVSKCHDSGVVHRDIKPQNIILYDNDSPQPFLLDFGLNYHEMTELEFSTLDQQEVGNRFLRLPELSAGSINKQDTRSDISFTAGILFYLLTGKHPDLLMDDAGAMPHQRRQFISSFAVIPTKQRHKLFSFFDNCFSYRTEDRYKDMDVFIKRLNQVVQSEEIFMSEDNDYESINLLLNEPSELSRTQTFNAVNAAFSEVSKVLEAMSHRIPNLLLSLSGPEHDNESCFGRHAWKKKGAEDAFVMIYVKISVKGSEFIVSITGKEIYRTSLSSPEWEEEFESSISESVLPKIASALKNPSLHIPELEYFHEYQPLTLFADAVERAKNTDKKILAFVYDNNQKNRGRLNWALMYFLQNAKTRELMSEKFITALVPLGDFSDYSTCLESQSMETARWILLDSKLNFVDQRVIIGNAEEAEKLMTNLCREFSGPFFYEK